jgi:hypothetical protein
MNTGKRKTGSKIHLTAKRRLKPSYHLYINPLNYLHYGS